MINLFLLRHAKSDWDSYNGKDFDRDIQKNGVIRTKKICKFLKNNKIIISKVLCSTALRTVKTFEIVCGTYKKNLNVKFLNELYHTTADNILNILRQQNNEKSIMVLGHEPSLSEFVRMMTYKINNQSHYEAINSYVTSGLCSLSFKVTNWKDITKKNSEFNFYIKPKDL